MRLILALLLTVSAFAQSGIVVDIENGEVFPGYIMNGSGLYDPTTLILDDNGRVRMLGLGYVTRALPRRGMVSLGGFGPDRSLNPTASWWDASTNMLLSSEDLTGAGWSVSNAIVNSQTTATFSAQYSYVAIISGLPTTINGASYTQYFRGRAISGNTNLHFLHGGIGSAVTAVTVTSTLADYVIPLTGDGAPPSSIGLTDRNASGWGQVEVTRWAVFPGTLTAAEAAAAYEATTTRQTIYDWSGNGNALTRGNTTNVETSDSSNLVESYNKAIIGTTENLQHASWVKTGSTAGSATQFTPSATDGQIVQAFTGDSGAVYQISATIASAGNTSLEWTLDAVETAVTVTASEVRYDILYTGDGAAANIGLRDPNASGYGAITLKEFQITRAPAAYAGDPLPYTNPSEPVFVCAACDYVTDDLSTMASLALSSDWTFHAMIRADDITGVGLWRDGTSTPTISLDANSKVSYAGGSTVASTAAVSAKLWHIVSVVKLGTTITHYLDGAANGSGTSASANDFAALQLGYDGSAYFDGAVANFLPYGHAQSASRVKSTVCTLAEKAWDYRSIPVFGAAAQCPSLAFE